MSDGFLSSIALVVGGARFEHDVEADLSFDPAYPDAAIARQPTLFANYATLAEEAAAEHRRKRKLLDDTRDVVAFEVRTRWQQVLAAHAEGPKPRAPTRDMIKAEVEVDERVREAAQAAAEAERTAAILAQWREAFAQRHEALLVLAGMDPREGRRRRADVYTPRREHAE
jgi:dihydroneopterin aldolase